MVPNPHRMVGTNSQREVGHQGSSNRALDEKFLRPWDLYLSLCETCFRLGRINVEQRGLVVDRRGTASLKLRCW